MKKLSARQQAVKEHQEVNNQTIIDSAGWIDEHVIDYTYYGQPIFDEADSAAIFAGGLYAISDNAYSQWLQSSVLWDEDGWRGGAGGGIKPWFATMPEYTAEWFDTHEPIGFINF